MFRLLILGLIYFHFTIFASYLFKNYENEYSSHSNIATLYHLWHTIHNWRYSYGREYRAQLFIFAQISVDYRCCQTG